MVEFSDGCLEVLPMPTILHQLIVEFLHSRLKAFLQSRSIPGRVLFAPLPLKLRPGKFREPDIVYLNPRRLTNLTGHAEGADLVMEVVSEGADNRQRDLDIKPREYAAAGIAEYWIVDPQEQQVTVFTLDGKEYRSRETFGRDESATSVFFQGFSIEVSELFDAAELPTE
jgi:Uma2 family endonuclease